MTDHNDIIPLRPDDDKQSQAAAWLAKLDRGHLTREERSELASWLAEDTTHLEILRDFSAFWYGLNEPLSQMKKQFPPVARTPLLDRLIPEFVTSYSTRFRAMAMAVAVSASVLFGVFMISYFSEDPSVIPKYYSTHIGEMRVISLADGSQIHLNTNTAIEQRFSKEERGIKLLSGEAIFDVAHNEDRPFKVYTPDGVIRAVGTRFSVRIKRDNVSVTVTEGRVALETRSPLNIVPMPVIVSKGEIAEISRQEASVTRFSSTPNTAERLAWAEGNLVFHDKNLQYVVNEISRYTPIQINVVDEALREQKITGILQIGDVNLMFEGIEGALGVKIVWVSDNIVHILKK